MFSTFPWIHSSQMFSGYLLNSALGKFEYLQKSLKCGSSICSFPIFLVENVTSLTHWWNIGETVPQPKSPLYNACRSCSPHERRSAESQLKMGWSLRRGLWRLVGQIPSGYVKITIESGHRNSGFTHRKWWFSIAMLVYQRVSSNTWAKHGHLAKMFTRQFSWVHSSTETSIQPAVPPPVL